MSAPPSCATPASRHGTPSRRRTVPAAQRGGIRAAWPARREHDCATATAGSMMPGVPVDGMVRLPGAKRSTTAENEGRVATSRKETRTPRSRSGRAREPASRDHARPLHPPQARPARDPRRGGPRPHRAQRRRDSPGRRDGVPGRSGNSRHLPRRGRRGGRRARALRARDVPPHHPGERAARVHAARTQPRQFRPARGRPHRALPLLGSSIRAGPRRGPALRDARRLPPSRADPSLDSLAAPLRRHRVRAGGHSRQQAPPRHALPPHPLLGSSLHGGVPRRGAGPGRGRHGEDRVR